MGSRSLAEDGATSPAITSTQGATLTLRLLPPDEEGRLRGSLDIDLAPGWKTYWSDPGPVGLPPRFDASGSRSVADISVAAPVPVWFSEGGERSAGYVGPASFAVEARASGPAPELALAVSLGLCRDICVPFSATLRAEPSPSLGTRAAVRAAFSALPEETASASWSVALAPDRRSLRVAIPAGDASGETALFVRGPDGWRFAEPAAAESDGTEVRFKVPVLDAPETTGDAVVDILLTSDRGARLSRNLPVAN